MLFMPRSSLTAILHLSTGVLAHGFVASRALPVNDLRPGDSSVHDTIQIEDASELSEMAEELLFTGTPCPMRFVKFHQVGGTTVLSVLRRLSKLQGENASSKLHNCKPNEELPGGYKTFHHDTPDKGEPFQITLLRNPVDKFLSRFYKKNFHNHVNHRGERFRPWPATYGILKLHNDEEMWDTALVDRAVRAVLTNQDFQEKYSKNFQAFQEYGNTFGNVSHADELLRSKFELVGITEAMPSFLKQLCQLVDVAEHYCLEPVSFTRANSERPRNESPELRAVIASYLPEEMEIYRLAQDLSKVVS